MGRVAGAALIALLSCPLAAAPRQTLVSPAADDTIGRVTQVTGDWFLEGAGERRKVVAGQELPPNTRLVAARFAGGGADTRAIELEMFDGQKPTYKCADGATCDGPIPLAVQSTGFVSIIRSVLRSLHRSKLTPLIIGKAGSGGVLEMKEGQIDLGGMVAAYMHEPTGKARLFRWCTAPTDQCVPIENVEGRSDDANLKVRPKNGKTGLYALEAWAPNRTADASWYVLAVDSQHFNEVFQTYTTIMQLPVFAQLTDAERVRAQRLLLEALAANLNAPR